MGGGSGGGRSQPAVGLAQNVEMLGSSFGRSPDGYLGKPGNSHRVRVIVTQEPEKLATSLFNKLSVGSDDRVRTKDGKGIMAVFSDGSRVLLRLASKSGSPVINLNFGPDRAPYKIHFEKEISKE